MWTRIILRSVWLDPVVYILIVKFHVEGNKNKQTDKQKQNKTKKRISFKRIHFFLHFAATNRGKKYKHTVIRIEWSRSKKEICKINLKGR